MALDTCEPAPGEYTLKDNLPRHSPLRVEAWSQELARHPDRFYVTYLLEGTAKGFRIGFNRRCSLHPCAVNMPTQNPLVILDYLQQEVQLGRTLRHGTRSPNIHLSPLGVIPKKHKPGKWRLIVDLSSPAGVSVNDGISTEWSSVSYLYRPHFGISFENG